jgi:hypothetical protein
VSKASSARSAAKGKQAPRSAAKGKQAPRSAAKGKQAPRSSAKGKQTPRSAAEAKPAPRSTAAARKEKPKKTHPIKVPPLPEALDRLREICLALPATTEELAWGEPTFRVAGKIFAMHASSGTHHGSGRPGVWILSVSLEQDLVLRARPDRYFKPPYVGPSGWIGAWLDNDPPWGEIAELLRDGWRRRAPKKIAALVPE